MCLGWGGGRYNPVSKSQAALRRVKLSAPSSVQRRNAPAYLVLVAQVLDHMS